MVRLGQNRREARLLASLGLVAGLGALVPAASSADGSAKSASTSSPGSQTIGLAITSWRWALMETPDLKECPNGLQPGEVAQLKATPGAVERIRAEGGTFEQRGPNGESPQHSPDLVKDPLPFRELVSKAGFGANLDGTPDGRATARTCKHDKFAGVDLTQGEQVDNQTARVLGCVQGFRTGGQTAEFYSNEVANFVVNRHLIEVTGVDSEVNDPAVEVRIYKGYDRVVRTADGNRFVPFLSQRIDTRYPQYNLKTKGRIVNGVLITDPISAVFPHSSERQYADRDMKDMTLRLKLGPESADGILAGYDNWKRQYELHSKRVVAELDKMSHPSIWHAYKRYADGYPDPKTGQCNYISAAYKITAVRSIIVHPAKPSQRIARN